MKMMRSPVKYLSLVSIMMIYMKEMGPVFKPDPSGLLFGEVD